MRNNYRDITSRINEPPIWYDEFAVPRYCAFTPDQIANIYADVCVLLLIECQQCRREFRVCMSDCLWDRLRRENVGIGDLIKSGTLHYGDPPNVDCCGAGPTMNCVDVRVLECWQHVDFEWKRAPELEIEIEGQPKI